MATYLQMYIPMAFALGYYVLLGVIYFAADVRSHRLIS